MDSTIVVNLSGNAGKAGKHLNGGSARPKSESVVCIGRAVFTVIILFFI